MLRDTQDNPIITSTDQPILTQDDSQNEVTTYLYKLYKEKDEENKSLSQANRLFRRAYSPSKYF